MARRTELHSAQCTFVGTFRFPEPVFFADRLHKSRGWSRLSADDDARFLAKADDINRVINRFSTYRVGCLEIKPIRNPRVAEGTFWGVFQPGTSPVTLTARAQPLFPFQVLFTGLEIRLARSNLVSALGATDPIGDIKVRADALLYPAGAGVLHVNVFIDAYDTGLAPESLLRGVVALRNLAYDVQLGGVDHSSHSGLGNLQSYLLQLLLGELLTENAEPRFFDERYVHHSLRGPQLSLATERYALARLLAGDLSLKGAMLQAMVAKLLTEPKGGRGPKDLVAISDIGSLTFLDTVLRNKLGPDDVRGLRDARANYNHHFESTIELALVSQVLVNEYIEMFRQYLAQLDARNLDGGRLRKIHLSVPFQTVTESILRVDERLSAFRRDGFWALVYRRAAAEIGLASQLQELADIATKIYDRGVEYTHERVQQIKDLGAAALKLIEVIKPQITIGG